MIIDFSSVRVGDVVYTTDGTGKGFVNRLTVAEVWGNSFRAVDGKGSGWGFNKQINTDGNPFNVCLWSSVHINYGCQAPPVRPTVVERDVTVFANFYPKSGAGHDNYNTEEEARMNATHRSVGVVKLTGHIRYEV